MPDESTTEPDDLLEEDDRPAGGKSRFLVSLGKPQLAALREYAAEKGLSVAEVVRRAVDEFFDRRSAGRHAGPPSNGE
ncbi:MAG: ribbon-helix-helix protein, CopG family [Planctomycetaceae bacterium]|nr:ribbon-helix-helix protein, CopG family [Planctomycetaceae bacterium]